MTKQQVQWIFEENYPGGEYGLEMAGGRCPHEVHERWIWFIDDLFQQGRITQRQRKLWDNDYYKKEAEQFNKECEALFRIFNL